MKNRFTVTISDVKGSKHYSLNQIVKKFLFYFVIFIGSMIIIGIVAILLLSREVNKLEFKREAIKQEMLAETTRLQNDLDEKIAYYQVVQGRIEEIENAMGIKPYEESITDVDQRLDHLSLTSAQRLLLLDFIPNGEVVAHNGISDKFGMRTHPILKTKDLHRGIDYRAKIGTPVYAPAQGVVEYAGMHSEKGLGSLVIINHSFGFKTYYAHLERKMVVKYGQFVKKGDHIANTGNSGLSTGPHLHYEVRFLGTSLDPNNFVKWSSTNFEEIFEKEKKIPWGSLLNSALQMISKTQKLQ